MCCQHRTHTRILNHSTPYYLNAVGARASVCCQYRTHSFSYSTNAVGARVPEYCARRRGGADSRALSADRRTSSATTLRRRSWRRQRFYNMHIFAHESTWVRIFCTMQPLSYLCVRACMRVRKRERRERERKRDREGEGGRESARELERASERERDCVCVCTCVVRACKERGSKASEYFGAHQAALEG